MSGACPWPGVSLKHSHLPIKTKNTPGQEPISQSLLSSLQQLSRSFSQFCTLCPGLLKRLHHSSPSRSSAGNQQRQVEWYFCSFLVIYSFFINFLNWSHLLLSYFFFQWWDPKSHYSIVWNSCSVILVLLAFLTLCKFQVTFGWDLKSLFCTFSIIY